MQSSLTRTAWFFGSCLSLLLSLTAAELRLSVTGLNAQHQPALLLQGLDAAPHAIQASTNLSNWFNLVSATNAGSELQTLQIDAPQLGVVYYRGIRLTEDPPLPAIVPLVDSNKVAVGVITYQEGGTLSLTNEGGTRFTFTVAPTNVLQSVGVTMELVTNLVSFPFENELRTAVKFSPDGFRFAGAGMLEIQFPTNVPHLKLSSFGFDGQGGDFHLMPDLIATNSVRIPVTHFSVFGTAVWGPTERSRAFETRVSNVESAGQHRTAEIFGREREQQLLGDDTGGDEAIAEAMQISKDYYDRHLKPELAAAEGDCSLFRTLVPRVLGHERQHALLGLGDSTGFLSSSSYQKSMCTCLNELISACEEASISAESFMRGMLGIERQAALLGGNLSEDCGTGTIGEWLSDYQDKKLPCFTKWLGTITYREGGSYTHQTNSTTVIDGTQPRTVVTSVIESMSVQYSFEGGVERVELEDDSIPGLFTSLTWDLFFYPDTSGAYSYRTDTRKSYECRNAGEVKQEDGIFSQDGAGTGSNEVRVHFVFEEGALTAFTILQRESFKLKIPVRNNLTRTDCPRRNPDTGELEEQAPKTIFNVLGDTTHTFPVNYVPTEQVVFTTQTADELTGTAEGVRQELVGPVLVNIPYKWTFSLKRRPE